MHAMPSGAPGRDGPVVDGRYTLLEVAGRGGGGTVWIARDELLARRVALKQVRLPERPPGLEDDANRARVLAEARAAALVHSAHTVTIYDVLEPAPDELWLVLELLDGCTLQQRIRERGPLSPPEVARLGLDLLDGLAAVHAAGVLHRDVKPANVMLVPDGEQGVAAGSQGQPADRAVLTDFGIAVGPGQAALTQTGT